jgi:hypothetical protein
LRDDLVNLEGVHLAVAATMDGPADRVHPLAQLLVVIARHNHRAR